MCLHTFIYHTKCGHVVPPRTWTKPKHCEPVAAALAAYHTMPERPLTEYPLTVPKICDRRFFTSELGAVNVDMVLEASKCPRCAQVQDSTGREKTDTCTPESSGLGGKKTVRRETGNSGKGRAGKVEKIHPHAILDRDVFRFSNLPEEPIPYVIRPADEALEVQMKERTGTKKKATFPKNKDPKQKRAQVSAPRPDPVPHRLPSVSNASHPPRTFMAPIFLSPGLVVPDRLENLGRQVVDGARYEHPYHLQNLEVQSYQNAQWTPQHETFSWFEDRNLQMDPLTHRGPVYYASSQIHSIPQFAPPMLYQFFPSILAPNPVPAGLPPYLFPPPRTGEVAFTRPNVTAPQASSVQLSYNNQGATGYYGTRQPDTHPATLGYGGAHNIPVAGPSNVGGEAMTKTGSQKTRARVTVMGTGSPIIVDGGQVGTKRVNVPDSGYSRFRLQPAPNSIKPTIKEETSLKVLDDGSIGWGDVCSRHLRSESIAGEERICELEDEKDGVAEMAGHFRRRDSCLF